MKRCLRPRLKTFTFKNGEVMTLCPDCRHGSGHEDQSTPIEGKLFRKGGRIEEPELDVLDTDGEEPEAPGEEISELTLPTFAALEDESEVPEQPGEESIDGAIEEEEIGEEIKV